MASLGAQADQGVARVSVNADATHAFAVSMQGSAVHDKAGAEAAVARLVLPRVTS